MKIIVRKEVKKRREKKEGRKEEEREREEESKVKKVKKKPPTMSSTCGSSRSSSGLALGSFFDKSNPANTGLGLVIDWLLTFLCKFRLIVLARRSDSLTVIDKRKKKS